MLATNGEAAAGNEGTEEDAPVVNGDGETNAGDLREVDVEVPVLGESCLFDAVGFVDQAVLAVPDCKALGDAVLKGRTLVRGGGVPVPGVVVVLDGGVQSHQLLDGERHVAPGPVRSNKHHACSYCTIQ